MALLCISYAQEIDHGILTFTTRPEFVPIHTSRRAIER
jgi:hypothetical protein